MHTKDKRSVHAPADTIQADNRCILFCLLDFGRSQEDTRHRKIIQTYLKWSQAHTRGRNLAPCYCCTGLVGTTYNLLHWVWKRCLWNKFHNALLTCWVDICPNDTASIVLARQSLRIFLVYTAHRVYLQSHFCKNPLRIGNTGLKCHLGLVGILSYICSLPLFSHPH